MPDAAKGTKAGPVPRMPDGKPDLGNGRGAWNPRTVVNLGGGGRQGPARSPVEKQVEIPFLAWSKEFYDKAQDKKKFRVFLKTPPDDLDD